MDFTFPPCQCQNSEVGLSQNFGGGNVPNSNIVGGIELNWRFLGKVELVALIISSMEDL